MCLHLSSRHPRLHPATHPSHAGKEHFEWEEGSKGLYGYLGQISVFEPRLDGSVSVCDGKTDILHAGVSTILTNYTVERGWEIIADTCYANGANCGVTPEVYATGM